MLNLLCRTGNFGNVLAGWLAYKMGLPISSFKVATNQNDILYRFFNTGVYAVDAVQPSLAPSMDIQVASNFERFIYYLCGEDAEEVKAHMSQLKETGRLELDASGLAEFSSSKATDAEIEGIIKDIYKRYHYMVDPHTACGFKELNPDKTSVVLATAHPAKFPETIVRACGQHPTARELEAIKHHPMISYPMPASADAVREFIRKTIVVGRVPKV